jgi:hypothetical protein
MQTLIHKRCFNHAQREAAGRCLSCSKFFCRECLVEHEERLTCAACLRDMAKPRITRRPVFLHLVQGSQILTGLFLLWIIFYLLGKVLLAMPSSVHEGTLWQDSWLNES